MSKEKVERYKAEKANRYNNLKKTKRKRTATKIGLWLFVLVVVAAIGTAIGFTAYNKYQSYIASLPNYTSTDKIISDMAGILETEEETTGEGETEAESAEQIEESKTSESTAEETQEAVKTASTQE